MSFKIVYTCDLCAKVGQKPFQSSMPYKLDEEQQLAPGWMCVHVSLPDKVVPEQFDELAATTPPGLADYGAALIKLHMQPFRTTLLICPPCRKTLGALDTVVREQIRAREYTDDGMVELDPPPSTKLRPVK